MARRKPPKRTVGSGFAENVDLISEALAELLGGKDNKDFVVESTLRCGAPKIVRGKRSFGISKLEVDVEFQANFYHIRDSQGTRRRVTMTFTGPVLKAEKAGKRSKRK